MKVLLLDTAFAAAPIYDALLAGGHEVWVMGNRESDLLAARAGDRWIRQDYSNVAAVEGHVEDHGFDRVVPGCTDVSIATCTQLSAMQGHIDSHDVNETLGNKARFRAVCEEINLRAPRVVSAESFPQLGKFICKPVDAFSGRGISIFDGTDPEALSAAIATAHLASPSGQIVLETFVEGNLHSCTGFVVSGRLTDTFYVIEGSSANPFAVDTSFVTYSVPAAFRDELESGLNRLAAAIGLRNGLLHTQFILAADGAYVVEVSRRCPGDLYSLLIEYSTGYPYAARYAAEFLGDSVEIPALSRRLILRHTVTADTECVFSGLRFRQQVPALAYFPLQTTGARLLARQGNRAGVFFCETKTAGELATMYDAFLARQIYDVG